MAISYIYISVHQNIIIYTRQTRIIVCLQVYIKQCSSQRDDSSHLLFSTDSFLKLVVELVHR